MRIMFADWLPGLVADANSFNAWSADKAAGTVVSHDGNGTIHPHVGKVAFDWRGITYRRGSQPHMLWMLSTAQAYYNGLDAAAKARADEFFGRTGGADIISLKLDRRMTRRNNLLVLAD